LHTGGGKYSLGQRLDSLSLSSTETGDGVGKFPQGEAGEETRNETTARQHGRPLSGTWE